jgi:hypothetical protein
MVEGKEGRWASSKEWYGIDGPCSLSFEGPGVRLLFRLNVVEGSFRRYYVTTLGALDLHNT